MPPVTRTQTGSLRPTKKTDNSTIPIQPQPRRRRKQRDITEILDSNGPLEIPRFIIDLSLPPEQRYVEVCDELQHEIRGLQGLSDEFVRGVLLFAWMPSAVLGWICWALLWRVYSREENRELKGICRATGIDMYLLVCFNVILDLLMGCSSGGAAVQNNDSVREAKKMVHFRTLDWGMPTLRRVLVQLVFVLEPEGEIVASNITYARFVGVLTGVRKNLSISLNFRVVHDDSNSLVANARYYGHLGMVLLGFRPSISSVLRGYLLPQASGQSDSLATRTDGAVVFASYDEVIREISCHYKPLLSTACYLCFSSGHETSVIENDLKTAKLSATTDFIVVTNADTVSAEDADEKPKDSISAPESSNPGSTIDASKTALEELIEDADERKECAEQNYRTLCRRRAKASHHGNSDRVLPTVGDIVTLVQEYPTTNECTHFAAVMDPLEGTVAWCRYWREPIEDF